MNDATVLRRNPQAVSAEVGDEIIFLHEGEAAYYSLSGVGTFLWRLLEAPQTVGDLVRMVLEEFEVSEEEFRGDLEALVQELTEKSLLDVERGHAE